MKELMLKDAFDDSSRHDIFVDYVIDATPAVWLQPHGSLKGSTALDVIQARRLRNLLNEFLEKAVDRPLEPPLQPSDCE